MAKDRKNHYQETPKKIKKLINDFKKSKKQYEMYLKLKENQEETWRKILEFFISCL